jgi:HAD superfamily hydrolase (TIGR01549 family)
MSEDTTTGRANCTYDAIVFDNDGVLVEPTPREVIIDALVDTFDSFGVDVDPAFAKRIVAEDLVPADRVREEYGLDPEAFWQRREADASSAQKELVREGGKPRYDDVAALDDLDVPMGLVSNNQHETVQYLLANRDLARHFATAYGRFPSLAGAAYRKPDPHYVERALVDLGVSNALYVGDSEKDVVAAQRAGVDAAFLRRDHVADVELSVTPTFEVPDLHALRETVTTTGVDAPDAI